MPPETAPPSKPGPVTTTAAGPKQRQKVACQGIGGRLFGHKFKKSVGTMVYNTDYCTRCGMPVGGWR